jgi:hypothetical protein
VALSLCVGTFVTLATHAQSSDRSEASSTYSATAADYQAAQKAKVVHAHSLPVRLPDGVRATGPQRDLIKKNQNFFLNPHAASPAVVAPFMQVLYPADLTYQGGAVLQTTQHHAIYLRYNGVCPVATCWGNPEGFLADLSRSNFIHVTDPYVGTSGYDRYQVGAHAFANFYSTHSFAPGSAPFTDNDMLALVHAVAKQSGQTGYGHLYHVFLPPGTDECFDNTYRQCYSPDNFNAFAFCAYHSSVVFNDIGEVLYSVEPYQNTPGCNQPPNTPNGQLADSTNSVLSHEVFETITDPDGTAWWNGGGDLDLQGYEIGDECQWVTVVNNNYYFYPGTFSYGGRTYAVQREYSNQIHGCSMGPY